MEEEGLLRGLAIADARSRTGSAGPMWGMPLSGGRDAATAARLQAQVRGAPVREKVLLHSGSGWMTCSRRRGARLRSGPGCCPA
eukprot:3888354-Amphidinium_carterae.1